MKVIITKYAVTSGVKIMEAELCKPPSMIKTDEMFGYYHHDDWHADKDKARDDVRKRFDRKRKNLNKQLSILADKALAALDVIEKAKL